jgi:hypothetical protein
MQLARIGRVWRGEAAKKMPVARGDIREIVDAPVFIPLYNLFLAYGKVGILLFFGVALCRTFSGASPRGYCMLVNHELNEQCLEQCCRCFFESPKISNQPLKKKLC